MNKFGIYIILLLASFKVMSQKTSPESNFNCSEKLIKARQAFFNGNFKLTVEYIEHCNSQDFEDQREILELLTKASLMQNKDDQADQYMAALLNHDPIYKIRSSDIAGFRGLFDTYEMRTKYSYGLELGINIPQYTILQYRSYAAKADQPKEYDPGTGISIGISGSYFVGKNLMLHSGLLFQTQQYSQKETILDYQSVSIKENINTLSIPLEARFQSRIGEFNPFVGIGIGVQRLISANGNIQRVNLSRDFPTAFLGQAQIVDDYDLSFQRKNWLLNYLISAGVRKRIGVYSFEFALRYEIGMNNLVDVNNRFSDGHLLQNYSYVPDDFKMDRVIISVSINKLKVYPNKK